MSYQVLARKWRPQTFNEVIGQQATLQALTNALNQQRLHHAYLFTGTRGVGKTTIARILAKCLNCENGVSATPCQQCAACSAIEQGRFVDLIEVDAASRTKVEDTRDLLNNVQYAPSQGRYKVYLIDEVHMLSGHSFNALLKTLEEPPPHVIFLLATTDPQKLPITILSRCLKFHLKNMLPDFIQQYLATLLEKENIAYEKEALNYIAKAADGSMRDALSLLDQAIAHGNNQIKINDVQAMLGVHDQKYIIAIIQALIAQDPKELLNITTKLAGSGTDFHYTLEELISTLQQIAIIQVTQSHEHDVLLTLSQNLSKPDVQLYYQIALNGRRDLAYSPNLREGFEMIVLRMLAFCPAAPVNLATEHLAEKKVVEQPKPAPLPSQPIASTPNNWEAILKQLPVTGLTQVLLSYCILASYQDNRVELTVDSSQSAMVNESLKQRVTEALSDYFGKPIQLKLEVAKNPIDCPARVAKIVEQRNRSEATEALTNDSNVQLLMQRFNATIQPESIESLKDES